MAASPEQMTLRQVFQLPSLRRLWTAQAVSIFGDFLALFAVISVISFRLHGSARQVTLVSIAYMLPLAFLGPLAGVFVDRWNVKATMIVSDLARGSLAILLVFVNNVWGFYAIFFAISMLSSFFTPAQSVAIRAIVPKEGLLSANALMMQALQVARILSPAIAGALVASFGAISCFAFDAASFYFSAAMLSTISVIRPGAPMQAARGVRTVLTDLASGMNFIFTHPAISFVILSMGAGLFAISCFSPLIAIYVRDQLTGGSLLFGIVSALLGIGMIVGTALLPKISQAYSKQQLVLAGLAMISFSIFVMAAVRSVAFTAAGMFGMGFGVGFVVAPAQALFQQETPIAMVGRVSSSVMSVLTIAQIVGLALSGSFAQQIGIRNLFFASAVGLAAVAIFGYFRLPSENERAAAA